MKTRYVRTALLCTLLSNLLLVSGCGPDSTESSQPVEQSKKIAATNEMAVATQVTNSEVSQEAYPLPILDGWKEIKVSYKLIGGGKVELWSGEFSYEGSSASYFVPYQQALTNDGFDEIVKDDTPGLQALNFTKIINGNKYVGDALFTKNWVKSSLQHFK